jgi:hypothetical protein
VKLRRFFRFQTKTYTTTQRIRVFNHHQQTRKRPCRLPAYTYFVIDYSLNYLADANRTERISVASLYKAFDSELNKRVKVHAD